MLLRCRLLCVGPSSTPTRCTSVMATLLRLRSQYQRVGGVPFAAPAARAAVPTDRRPEHRPADESTLAETLAGSCTASTPQASLAAEAMRLLSSKTRAADALSDVSQESPAYCVEVGKLLSVASLFGATSQTPRVREVLSWLRTHTEMLTTTRQVMSVAMPAVGLQDGPTAGRAFVLQHLTRPLLASLQSSGREEAPRKASADDGASRTTQPRQQRGAVVSVYVLSGKLVEFTVDGDGATTVDTQEGGDLQQTLQLAVRLMELATQQLLLQRPASVPPDAPQDSCGVHQHTPSLLPLDASDAAAILNALQNVLKACKATGGVQQTTRLQTVFLSLFPALDFAVSASGARALDLVRASDALLSLRAELTDATAVSRVDELLASIAQGLPSTVASASVRDLCAVVQAVNRVRSSPKTNGGALSRVLEHTLSPLMESLRPRLFLLAETHRAQLRQVECSMLVSGMSRWEHRDGGDAAHLATACRVPDDVLALLCDQFEKKVSYALPAHLTPFLQGLARLELARQPHSSRHRARGELAARDDGRAGVIVSSVSSAAQAIEASSAKASQLLTDGRLSALDAAHILAALAQLRTSECLRFFSLAEKQLLAKRERRAPCGEAPDAGCLQANTALRSALQLAERHAVIATPEDAAVFARLQQQQARVLQDVVEGLAYARTPKELVLLFSALHPNTHAASGGTAEERVDEEGEEQEMSDIMDSTAHDGTPIDKEKTIFIADTLEAFPTTRFLERVRELSPLCSAFEVASLSMATAQLHKAAGHEPGEKGRRRDAEAALSALLQRTTVVVAQFKVSELKKLLDALRMSGTSCPMNTDARKGVESVLSALSCYFAAHATPAHNEDALPALRAAVGMGRSLLSFWHFVRRAAWSSSSSVSLTLEDAGAVRDGLTRAITAFFAYASGAAAAGSRLLSVGHESAMAITSASTPPSRTPAAAVVENLVVLAHVASQLYGAVARSDSSVPAAPPSGEGETGVEPAEVEHEEEGKDPRFGSGPEDAGRENQDAATAALANPVEALLRHVSDGVAAAVEASRDAQRLREGSAQPQPGTPAVGACAPKAAEVVAVSCVLSTKQLVMLARSMEVSDSAAHNDLFFRLLPELRVLASAMEPLEVSLLMNAMNRMGVWNSRVMGQVALETVGRMRDSCDLRQCAGILREMQRSGFLPASAFTRPDRRRKVVPDWHTAVQSGEVVEPPFRTARAEDPLLSLGQAAVNRLDSFVVAKDSLAAMLTSNTLEALTLVVQTLGYFNTPPQPTFDTYFVLAVKKLFDAARRAHARAATRPATTAELRALLLGAVALGSRVQLLRRSDHQQVTSATITAVAHYLLSACRGRTHHKRLSRDSALMRALEELSLGKLAELHQAARTNHLLYATAICRKQERRTALNVFTRSNNELLTAALCVFFERVRSRSSLALSLPAGGDALGAEETLGSLQQLWRVIAPLPVCRKLDPLARARAHEHLSCYVSAYLGVHRQPSLHDGAVLCDCLSRALCCFWRRGRGRQEDSLAVGRLRVSLSAVLAATLGDCSTLAGDESPFALTLVAAAPAQATAFLLAMSLCNSASHSLFVHAAQALRYSLQRPLPVPSAVDVLLAFSLHADATERSAQASGTTAEVHAFWVDAAKGLVPRLGRPHQAGASLCSCMYRLLVSYDGVFVRYCVGVACRGEAATVDGGALVEVLLRAVVTLMYAPSLSAELRSQTGRLVSARVQRGLSQNALSPVSGVREKLLEVEEVAALLAKQ